MLPIYRFKKIFSFLKVLTSNTIIVMKHEIDVVCAKKIARSTRVSGIFCRALKQKLLSQNHKMWNIDTE